MKMTSSASILVFLMNNEAILALMAPAQEQINETLMKSHILLRNGKDRRKRGVMANTSLSRVRVCVCVWTPYLADILVVVSRVFLKEKELIPHPSAFGPLKNPPIALHPKQFPYIPRRERHGVAGPQRGERQQEQNLIGYHGIQSGARGLGRFWTYGSGLLRG